MSSTPAVPPATTSALGKLLDWLKKIGKDVEIGIEDVLGSKATAAIATAAEALIADDFGPVALQAMTEATDVASGTMSISAAAKNVLAAAEAAGKQLTSAGALQIIGLLQTQLSGALGKTITPVS